MTDSDSINAEFVMFVSCIVADIVDISFTFTNFPFWLRDP